MASFRQLFKWLVPSWLSSGDGEKVLHSLALIKDAFAERALQGLEARFPSRTGASALKLTGADRGIQRGRAESDAVYAQRLLGWRYPRGHRVRGSAFGLLGQVWAYFGGVECWTIDARGNRHDVALDGSETYSYGVTWDWDGVGSSPRWGRFWLGIDNIFEEQPDLGDATLWGGALGTPGYTIGVLGMTPEDVAAIRRLFSGRPWKPAGTRAEWLIVNITGSSATPDGDWLHWSANVGGIQRATRYVDSDWRFISLSPATNNTYSGNPDSFCTECWDGPDSATFAGDLDSFPLSATLPNGVVYAGNSASFPVEVQLIDDGTAP